MKLMELSGIKKLKDNSIKIINSYSDSKFSFVDQKLFEGKKNIFYNSISSNLDIIMRSIDHYVKFWPKRPLTKVHGDLTIDNIIYSPNKIRFIDWELYGTSNEIWGYDLVYLVISSIFLIITKKSISKMKLKNLRFCG